MPFTIVSNKAAKIIYFYYWPKKVEAIGNPINPFVDLKLFKFLFLILDLILIYLIIVAM